MRLVQSNPPAKLSITHIADLQRGTKSDVVQPGEGIVRLTGPEQKKP